MRIYSAASEEAFRARKFLKDWAAEGLLTEAQHHRMEHETVCDLRTTNIFLRLVLFFFTFIIVGAAVMLFFVGLRPSEQVVGVCLLVIAPVCYAGAELAVAQARLYRYGIEEALAACSVGFLCAGMQIAFASGSESLVLVGGAIASLWIWHRFGLWYAFLAAMIFVLFLPSYWTASHSAQHVIIAAFYVAGLACVAVLRSSHRFDYLNDGYSLVEALLWLGIYLAINLRLSSPGLLGEWWLRSTPPAEFSKPFYWTTWVLIWCLPPIVLTRGVVLKDRWVMATGLITVVLTLVSNKPYLGWPRHTWDPMLLGLLLTGVSVYMRRWLTHGPGGIRYGFTAERLSGKYKNLMSAGSVVIGMIAPHAITPEPQASSPDVRFGGGDSGGGGASGDF